MSGRRHFVKAKVINTGKLLHTEKFKGKEIKIPSNKFIYMDYNEAIQFKGQYFSKPDGKRIQVEPMTHKQSVDAGLISVPKIEGVDNDTGTDRDSSKKTA